MFSLNPAEMPQAFLFFFFESGQKLGNPLLPTLLSSTSASKSASPRFMVL